MITVIDLLNKIANSEEVPKRILFEDLTYEYEDGIDYKNGEGLEKTFLLDAICNDKVDLNKEVKILDEPKEHKKIIKIKEENGWCGKQSTGNEIILKMKVNELIDEVNKLKEKI